VSEPPTAARLVERGAEELARAGLESSRNDSEVLLRHALGWTRESLLARLSETVSPEAAGHFFQLLDRRRSHVPLQYITGFQEFWGLSFRVTPAVLIPRTETEGIVEAVRARLTGPVRIIDVGAGSGCITTVVAYLLRESYVWATDVSAAALAVARENAARHGVSSRVEFLEGDLLEPIRETGFDAIVSNPPYVAEHELLKLPPEVKDHEPRLALAAGAEGLDVLRRLIPAAAERLRDGGYLIFEIAHGMEASAKKLIAEASLAWETTEPDLQGIPRIVVARRG